MRQDAGTSGPVMLTVAVSAPARASAGAGNFVTVFVLGHSEECDTIDIVIPYVSNLGSDLVRFPAWLSIILLSA